MFISSHEQPAACSSSKHMSLHALYPPHAPWAAARLEAIALHEQLLLAWSDAALHERCSMASSLCHTIRCCNMAVRERQCAGKQRRLWRCHMPGA